MNFRHIFIALLLGATIGAGLVVYNRPEQQTKVVEVEKIKTQTVTTILKPDGTKITKTEDKTQDIRVQKSEVKNNKAKYRLTGSYSIQKQSYGIGAETRLIGPVWLGAEVNQLGVVQVRFGIEF